MIKYGYILWSQDQQFIAGSDANGEFFDTHAQAKSRAEQYVKDADENLDSKNNTYEIYKETA